MAINLSNPAELANLTRAGAETVANIFGANPNDWQLEEASFNGVIFHVLDTNSDYSAGLNMVSDKGGNRVDIIEYAYKDGQTTDALGRKGVTHVCDGVLFGINYKSGLQALLVEFTKQTPGVLIHPILGEKTVRIVDYEMSSSYDSLQAIKFRFTFTEHDFDLGNIASLVPEDIGGLLSDALNILSGISNVINIVNNTVAMANAVKATITNYLETAKETTSDFLVSSNLAFNSSPEDYPSLLPVNQGGNRDANGDLQTTVYIAGSSTPVPIPLSQVPADAINENLNFAPTPQQVQNDLIQARNDLQTSINSFKQNGFELEFYNEILFLTQSAVELQKVYEVGLVFSKKTVFDYELPYDMSLFNAGFLNNIPTTRIVELANLNNDLESILWIEKGTKIKMPTS